jgi:hypothetical protein
MVEAENADISRTGGRPLRKWANREGIVAGFRSIALARCANDIRTTEPLQRDCFFGASAFNGYRTGIDYRAPVGAVSTKKTTSASAK